jgi:hypothetical protein
LANPYKRVAAPAWDAVSDRMQGRFDLEAVEDEMEVLIKDVDIDELRATARYAAVVAEDRRRRDLANSGQLDLWNDDAFQGAIPTVSGDANRVTLDAAENFDWLYLLQVKQKHVNEVVAVMNSTMEAYTALAPYLAVPGTRTADARAAWQRDSRRP